MKNQPAYVSEFYENICRLMVYSRETNQSLYLYKTIIVITGREAPGYNRNCLANQFCGLRL